MVTEISGTSIEFSLPSVGGTWSWKVRANNLRAAGQLYEVVDVITPFGPITTAAIPLPGEVISAMANSVLDVQAQFAPFMVLAQGSTSFSIIVTEGDPNSEAGTASVYNGGAFGSFMTVVATPGASWLGVSPSSYQSIGKNERATFGISLLSTTLLASGSPYSGVVNLQDNRVPPTNIPFTINVTVLPRPVIACIPSSISLSFMSSTGVPGGSQQLTISNSGPVMSSLEFTLVKVNGNSPWLDVVPISGGPLASGQSEIITVSVIAQGARGLAPGTYMETIRIHSDNASNSPIDVGASLVVIL
jgi:hypothetical protein